MGKAVRSGMAVGFLSDAANVRPGTGEARSASRGFASRKSGSSTISIDPTLRAPQVPVSRTEKPGPGADSQSATVQFQCLEEQAQQLATLRWLCIVSAKLGSAMRDKNFGSHELLEREEVIKTSTNKSF